MLFVPMYENTMKESKPSKIHAGKRKFTLENVGLERFGIPRRVGSAEKSWKDFPMSMCIFFGDESGFWQKDNESGGERCPGLHWVELEIRLHCDKGDDEPDFCS